MSSVVMPIQVLTTVGEAWAACVAEMINVFFASNNPADFTHPTNDTLADRRTISFTFNDHGLIRIYHFVIDSLSGSDTISIWDFANQPGSQQTIGAPLNAAELAEITYEFIKNVVLHGLGSIILSLTDASSFTETWNEIYNSHGSYKTAVRTTVITNGNIFVTMIDGVRGCVEPLSDWGFTYCSGPTSPTVKTAVLSGSDQLGAVANAIQDITDQDFELGLNQNAALFSVKSKVVVGP